MSNKKHPKCKIRTMAKQAKDRLKTNEYDSNFGELAPPKGITPSQRNVYLKLKTMFENGEDIKNPIQQLADREMLMQLSHQDRQRYILQLSADYVEMRKTLTEKMQKSKIS